MDMRKLASLCLVLVLGATPLTACSESGTNDDTVEGTLSFYTTSTLDIILDPAIALFQERFPDVEINREPTSDSNLIKKLNADLEMGTGPDMVFWNNMHVYDNVDLFSNDWFYDLNLFTEQDTSFNRLSFVEPVLDAGIVDGKQLAMPLSYSMPLIMTTQENNEAFDLSAGLSNNFETFAQQTTSYLEQYGETGNRLTTSKPDLTDYHPTYGLAFFDYANRQAIADTGQLTSFLSLYQTVETQYEQEEFTEFTPEHAITSLQNHQVLFSFLENPLYQWGPTFSGLQNVQTPIYTAMPSFDEKAYAYPTLYAGIKSGSQMKEVAYEFLKILLSKEIQMAAQQSEAFGSLWLDIPVQKEAATEIYYSTIQQYQEDATIDGITHSPISAADSEAFLNTILNPDAANNTSAAFRVLFQTVYFDHTDQSIDGQVLTLQDMLQGYMDGVPLI